MLKFCLKGLFSEVIISQRQVPFENRRLGIINGLILFKDVLRVQQYLYRPVTTKSWDGLLLSIKFDELEQVKIFRDSIKNELCQSLIYALLIMFD